MRLARAHGLGRNGFRWSLAEFSEARGVRGRLIQWEWHDEDVGCNYLERLVSASSWLGVQATPSVSATLSWRVFAMNTTASQCGPRGCALDHRWCRRVARRVAHALVIYVAVARTAAISLCRPRSGAQQRRRRRLLLYCIFPLLLGGWSLLMPHRGVLPLRGSRVMLGALVVGGRSIAGLPMCRAVSPRTLPSTLRPLVQTPELLCVCRCLSRPKTQKCGCVCVCARIMGSHSQPIADHHCQCVVFFLHLCCEPDAASAAHLAQALLGSLSTLRPRSSSAFAPQSRVTLRACMVAKHSGNGERESGCMQVFVKTGGSNTVVVRIKPHEEEDRGICARGQHLRQHHRVRREGV